MSRKNIIWLIIFSIAMGYFESAVVVYLREIYYPGGFEFPLKFLDERIAITELFREASTLIMIAGISFIAARKFADKFASFLIVFAIWDIFYYVFLKLILNWPGSLMTYDILFLLPSTWIGPVIAPVINSLSMILLGAIILHFSGKTENNSLARFEWTLLIAGSLIIVFSYLLDYGRYMLEHMTLWEFILVKDPGLSMELATEYVPSAFNWYIFLSGQAIILLATGFYFRRMSKKIA